MKAGKEPVLLNWTFNLALGRVDSSLSLAFVTSNSNLKVCSTVPALDDLLFSFVTLFNCLLVWRCSCMSQCRKCTVTNVRVVYSSKLKWTANGERRKVEMIFSCTHTTTHIKIHMNKYTCVSMATDTDHLNWKWKVCHLIHVQIFHCEWRERESV